ncbi:DCC1-like thiol-disulfide oxidoreductase family protein [Paenibacillus timonensis]|nr:DCC1-like thiol-disulfide oxidoreductase family protein [Paenibacillus timonensis]
MVADRFLIGTSLLRISIGLILLYQYFIHYGQRHFLFSSRGMSVLSDELKLSLFSLYNLSDSLIYFDIIYHLGIVVSFVYLLGFKGRIFALLNFIFFYSLHIRYGQIGDGGDNLLIICLFLLIFSNSTAYFSFDSARFQQNRERKRDTFVYQVLTIFHNFSVFFCIVQLCILYFFSGLYQIMGDLWQNGTAIYYISQVNEFSRPFLKYMVDNHLWLMVLGTYFSVFIKIAFPFCLLNKKLKPLVVAGMIVFHTGIAIGMGLLTFSLIMMMMELIVFTDEEYRKGLKKIVLFGRKLQVSWMRLGRSVGRKWFYPYRIVIFYDGWCPMCQSIMRNLRRLDYLGLLRYISFRDPKVIKQYNLDSAEVEKRMHSMRVSNKNTMKVGIHSVIQISSRLAPLWLFVPFLYLSSKIGVGALVYDFIASRRNLLPINHCDENCEINHVTIHR